MYNQELKIKNKKSKTGSTTRRESTILHFAFFIFICLISVSLIASCGKKEVKKVSPESTIANELFGIAETIRNAYVKNDRATLERNSTKEGYRELIGAMKSFDSVELTFTPRWVDIEDSVIYLNVSWKGTWVVSGKKNEERGMAIFVLEGKPPKLARVLRANPFKQPE
jgi:hypothetical protein